MNVCNLLEKRRRSGSCMKKKFLSQKSVSLWHHFSLRDCRLAEFCTNHVFLGFTANGNFLVSYTVDAVQNEIVDSYTYKIHWWSICRSPKSRRLSLKTIKSSPLFEGRHLSLKVIIWIYHWPNDESKLIVHGIDKMCSFNLQFAMTSSSGVSDFEYQSMINVFPNPQTASSSYIKNNNQDGKACNSHDWSVYLDIPTQSSFKLPNFYRDLTIINNALIYTNGFTVKFVEFIFDGKSSQNQNFSANVKSSSEKLSLQSEKTMNFDCVEINSAQFLSQNGVACNCSFAQGDKLESTLLSEHVSYSDDRIGSCENNPVGSSLSLKFHEVATSKKKSKESCFLKVTEVCLGIEEMMGSILDSDYSEALQKLNLDLILTDYTTIVLSVCPLLYNVLFKTPAVFVDRLSGFFFKSSFLIRWNFTSGVFEVIKREEIKKTSERQLNVNAEVKPLFQTNWREHLKTSQFPLDSSLDAGNNVPFLVGKSKSSMFNRQQHLLLKL